MNRNEAREELKRCLPQYAAQALEKAKGKGLYNCPFCGSGTGPHGTGALSILPDGKAFFCHACEKRGDIFDLIGELEHISDHNGQLERACQLFGVSIDTPQQQPKAREVFTAEGQNPAKNGQYAHNNIHTNTYTHEHTHNNIHTEPQDFRAFFLSAHKDIDKTDYPARRGIGKAIIDRFYIGYAAEWKHPKAPASAPATPRLIIPTSRGSYLARDTRENVPEYQQQYTKQKVGPINFLNISALDTAERPIYIVEGEIDALSIMEVGGEAIALGTTTKKKAFTEYAAQHRPKNALIIALDNDEAGEKAAEELLGLLAGQRIPAYRYNPYGENKDANEALVKNRAAFSILVQQGEHAQEEAEKAALEEYKKKAAINYIGAFMDGVKASADTPATQTGFERLDALLDGGLYEGLHLLGAVSSIGKTTFILQMADQIAAQGHDVLYFSLEMARFELMAKSISRLTYEINMEDPEGMASYPKTTRGITAGAKYKHYSQKEKALIKEAVLAYSQYAGNIYIFEGVGNIGVAEIREAVGAHIRHTGKTPIVFIDYLQILAPYNDRGTDKQNTDKAITELKRISRDFKLPLIAISSFNRASYNTGADMAAFKESGSLEYSSDILLALQFWKPKSKDYLDLDEEKKKNPRKIELKILKNRNGPTSDKIAFHYDPRFNYYEELEEDFDDETDGGGSEEERAAAAKFLKEQKRRKK